MEQIAQSGGNIQGQDGWGSQQPHLVEDVPATTGGWTG